MNDIPVGYWRCATCGHLVRDGETHACNLYEPIFDRSSYNLQYSGDGSKLDEIIVLLRKLLYKLGVE